MFVLCHAILYVGSEGPDSSDLVSRSGKYNYVDFHFPIFSHGLENRLNVSMWSHRFGASMSVRML